MRCLLNAKSKANRRQRAGNKLSLLGSQSSTDFPEGAEDRRKEQGKRRRRRKMRRERQEVRTNSPHWLPGPFGVVLNGPEQR